MFNKFEIISENPDTIGPAGNTPEFKKIKIFYLKHFSQYFYFILSFVYFPNFGIIIFFV